MVMNSDAIAVGASARRPHGVDGGANGAMNGANAVRPYSNVMVVGASGGRPHEVDGDE